MGSAHARDGANEFVDLQSVFERENLRKKCVRIGRVGESHVHSGRTKNLSPETTRFLSSCKTQLHPTLMILLLRLGMKFLGKNDNPKYVYIFRIYVYFLRMEGGRRQEPTTRTEQVGTELEVDRTRENRAGGGRRRGRRRSRHGPSGGMGLGGQVAWDREPPAPVFASPAPPCI